MADNRLRTNHRHVTVEHAFENRARTVRSRRSRPSAARQGIRYYLTAHWLAGVRATAHPVYAAIAPTRASSSLTMSSAASSCTSRPAVTRPQDRRPGYEPPLARESRRSLRYSVLGATSPR